MRTAPPIAAARRSFALKVGAALLLVVAADLLFYNEALPGWTLGLFMLAWVTMLATTSPALRHRAAVPLAIAAAMSVVLAMAPNLLAFVLCLAAIGSAALLPRARFDDALSWAARLVALGAIGLIAAPRDAVKVVRRSDTPGRMRIVRLLPLPLAGAVLFTLLFATANPLIGRAFAAIALPDMSDVVLHLLFWSVVLALIWPSLRARHGGIAAFLPRPTAVRDMPVATLVLSLAAFNLIFAVENGLDLAFLWSGAALPHGVTLADYAHQGAYTLIATALLAGGFVLLLLDPASAAAKSIAVRRLVVAWVGQNVLLVASSILRLLDYIAAYSLTELRVAALAWMALVGLGLLLIGWRLIAGRSARWLINANALAGTLVLGAFSVIDTDAIVANWNVTHARSSDDLDLCYLDSLGPSALPAMIDLEARAGGPQLRDRAASMRIRAIDQLATAQADWHRWTWRGARQLAAARERLGDYPRTPQYYLTCRGEATLRHPSDAD